MDYFERERSLVWGEPIELYRFRRGFEYWTYNNTARAITYETRIYEPVLISGGDIELTTNSLKNLLRIKVDRENPFAISFISTPVEHITELVIFRGQGGESSNFVEYWKGYVYAVEFLPKIVEIIASPKTNSLKRSGLMRKYQRSCGYQIYSRRCTLLKTNYEKSGTIISIEGTKIEATIFGTEANNWFTGGLFEADNRSQMVIWHEGNFVRIAHRIVSLEVGMSFKVYAGCDHSSSTCKDKFGNKINYGGQEFIPDKNPFVGDSVAT